MLATWLLGRTTVSLFLLSILSVIALGCLVVCYIGLRVMRAPVKWLTLLIGLVLSGLMLWSCIALALHPVFSRAYLSGSLAFGDLAFIVAVFATAEWPLRRWYVAIKGRFWHWLTRQSRAFFLYLRDHHTFFGWLTLLASAAHTVLTFPELGSVSSIEVWTGVVALVALAALTVAGEWIAWATRHKRLSKRARWWHLALTLGFILAFAAHA